MSEAEIRVTEKTLIPEMVLSEEGYVQLKGIVKAFCTNLVSAQDGKEITKTISEFKEKLMIYRWLCCFDVAVLLDDMQKFYLHDITRGQLVMRCSSLIAALNGEIALMKGFSLV